ncbi:MAG: hypothetical protein K0Q79_1700 [Flavipsychrobacter sp.]|jgi:hypothetical protein|nr:hypothetical protein [Flavipsychrobacter sp.]
MKKEVNYEYGVLTLSAVLEKLRTECYEEMETLCNSASMQLDKLQQTGLQHSTSQYTANCRSVIADVRQIIADRKEKYIPYLQSLFAKAETNHDCGNCTGNCKLQHDLHLVELDATHTTIRKILSRLQMAGLPLYSDTAYPDMYRVLRNHIALIENCLAEIYFIEENYLLPKVIAAQKKINASGK